MSRLPELFRAFQTVEDIPSGLRFFWMDKAWTIRCVQSKLFVQEHQQEFDFIHRLPLQRGLILDVFARLEGFINEFLHLKFFGLSYTYADEFDRLLEFVNFSDRVRLIREWGMITRNCYDKIRQANQTRNYLAHAWDDQAAMYRKKPLNVPENFAWFKGDLVKIFDALITQYQQEQQKHNFDDYIDQLIEKIQGVTG